MRRLLLLLLLSSGTLASPVHRATITSTNGMTAFWTGAKRGAQYSIQCDADARVLTSTSSTPDAGSGNILVMTGLVYTTTLTASETSIAVRPNSGTSTMVCQVYEETT